MSEYSLISIIKQLQIMNKIIYIQPLVLFVCIHSFRSDSQTSSIWNPSDRNNPSPYFIFQTEFSLFKRFKTKTKTKTKKKRRFLSPSDVDTYSLRWPNHHHRRTIAVSGATEGRQHDESSNEDPLQNPRGFHHDPCSFNRPALHPHVSRLLRLLLRSLLVSPP